MNDAEKYRVNPGLKLLLSDAGINPDDVLRRAMLPHDLFAGEKAWLTPEEFFRLWGAIEDEADDPLLPIRIGQSISVETFDPLAFAALCSRDLNSAAHRVAGYKRIVGPMRLVVETTPAETSMELQWPDSTVAPPSLAMVDLVFIVALARIATRSSIRPLRVSSLVPPEHTDEYADFLGVAVSQGISYKVIFSAADAARPFLTVNEPMWQTFEPQLRLRLAEPATRRFLGGTGAVRARGTAADWRRFDDGSRPRAVAEYSEHAA
ncbi:AraC family transcriptional regulator ligand-binding domain-containing protein [Cryobacterium breve]|uniref:AraC family transcriptional regulator ligand-binding domain-containing protein n=1 Tax=Cryobacterium breve TaxID=1259258 RepID=A0ABY7NF93_9MICO|nr:AraC family transcriptional regulator ligand-binding domain-containing protein [Cryobacterium breve]WBM80228.1 AraC family transcriptional regulator ligand-binding domain-containing protein [Cryobacterium breve]